MNISNEAFDYLVLQRGDIYDYHRDREVWEQAYLSSLELSLGLLQPYLPRECASILDIGGGVGGIDVLLARQYPDVEVAILDGEDELPVMMAHDKPFNNLKITEQFLADNGVAKFTPLPAHHLPPPKPFDLILSFRSWCFHYPPETYLDYVKACCHPKTVLILDVRKGRPWHKMLLEHFKFIDLVEVKGKCDRVAFYAR